MESITQQLGCRGQVAKPKRESIPAAPAWHDLMQLCRVQLQPLRCRLAWIPAFGGCLSAQLSVLAAASADELPIQRPATLAAPSPCTARHCAGVCTISRPFCTGFWILDAEDQLASGRRHHMYSWSPPDAKHRCIQAALPRGCSMPWPPSTMPCRWNWPWHAASDLVVILIPACSDWPVPLYTASRS